MIRTRFAPSPTGFLHVGGAYSALLDYAFAKKKKGKFIIRIEDTDLKRFVKGSEEKIYEGLEWLGIEADESPKIGGPYGPYRQSERLPIYKKHAQALVNKGLAYYCFCSPKKLAEMRAKFKKKDLPPMYDRCCRDLNPSEARKRILKEKFVIRLKVPFKEKIVVEDLLRGKVVFDSRVVDDQILLKSDGFPTYHLAVVVDDHLMKISHVVRGEEWLSSAPKHVLLYRFFDWEIPFFLHTPIIRNPDRSKLSKRQGHTSLSWYQENGYLPEALLNFLFLLGWSHPEEKEIFSLTEFIKHFDLKDLSAVGPVFGLKKLDWMNGCYIRNKSDKELLQLIKPFAPKGMSDDLIAKTVPSVKERIKRLSDYSDLVKFLVKREKPKVDDLVQKGRSSGETKAVLLLVKNNLESLSEKKWNPDELQKNIQSLVEETGWPKRDFYMSLRVAITGRTISPPLFDSIAFLGKKETLSRLKSSANRL